MASAPSENDTTEQQYLEMAEHMKELVEAKDKELKKMKILYMNSKKTMSKIYGLIRVIDEDSAGDDGYFMEWIVGEIRSTLSDFLFGDEERLLDIYGE
jgi:hypothetical protein